MTNYFEIPAEFTRYLHGVEQVANVPKIGTERHFATLQVEEGDRVRLTELAPESSWARGAQREIKDPAVLEGSVLGIKRKGGPSQLRIKGFDHTGGNSGGQHVWFPVNGYKVEVLHRAYRWTAEDKVVVAVAGLTESQWVKFDERNRQTYRDRCAARVAKVKAALGVDDE